jgi:hypothetical protein
LSHSSGDVLCFSAAVLFVQANLNFEWKLQLFINVVSFHFVECKKIEKIRFLSDPIMKLSICDSKIMNSFCDFFQNFKKLVFLKIQISKIF